MTFEERRRAAFEEWFRERFWVSPVENNGQLSEGAYHCYETWQAALEWQNKGERE